MISESNLIKAYTYFYRAKYNSKKYTYDPSPKDIKILATFFKLLKKHYSLLVESLGEDFLWTYFAFQFNYWDPLDIQSFNNKINIALIIGKKAFERFEYRDKEYDWQFDSLMIITKYKLSKQDFVNFVFTKETKNEIREVNSAENYYRGIKHNTIEGFVFCIQNTSLFDEKSKWCVLCKSKIDCKKIKDSQ